jgi:hypothetical protein
VKVIGGVLIPPSVLNVHSGCGVLASSAISYRSLGATILATTNVVDPF